MNKSLALDSRQQCLYYHDHFLESFLHGMECWCSCQCCRSFREKISGHDHDEKTVPGLPPGWPVCYHEIVFVCVESSSLDCIDCDCGCSAPGIMGVIEDYDFKIDRYLKIFFSLWATYTYSRTAEVDKSDNDNNDDNEEQCNTRPEQACSPSIDIPITWQRSCATLWCHTYIDTVW